MGLQLLAVELINRGAIFLASVLSGKKQSIGDFLTGESERKCHHFICPGVQAKREKGPPK